MEELLLVKGEQPRCADCGRLACPICREAHADTNARPDARGWLWCQECIDEHDAIDWEKVAEDRMDGW